MKTQELKSYIDRVLGNSIRCLLPSYWWKRAFGAVIDNAISRDEVKTINGESIVGEGNLKVGVTTVGSIDELNALEAEVGDIATVGEESTMLVSVGDLQQVDDPSEILEKWDNLTRIVKVEFGEPVTENGYHTTVYLNGKKPYVSDTILITSSEGGFYCGFASAGGMREITIEAVNERLKNHDYRFIMGINVDVIDSTFKLHAYSASADAYIKSYSWEKLSKEYVVSSEEELNRLSVPNGTIAKVCKELSPIKIDDCYYTTNMDTISEDWDKLTIIKAVEEKGNPSSDGGSIYLVKTADGMKNGDLLVVGWDDNAHAYGKHVKGEFTRITKDEFNTALKSEDYRFAYGYNWKGIDSYFDFYANSTVFADAYIKGETWIRFLKEGDVVGGGAEALSIYFPFGEGTQLSAEQKNSNADTYSALQSSNKKSIHFYVVAGDKGTVWFPVCHYYQSKPQGGEAYFNIITYDWDDNSPFQKLHFKLYSDGRIEAVEYIKADSELSDTSENPVQNKVVTTALNEKASIAYVNEKVANISSEEGLEYRKLYAKGDTLGIVTGELTSEQKAYNIETINLYWQNKAIIGYEQVIGEINRISLCKGTDSNGESINFYFDHVLNASVLISITISADGSGTYYSDNGLLIDSVVLDSSTNPVQNKAIKTYVDNAIAEAITNTINTPV